MIMLEGTTSEAGKSWHWEPASVRQMEDPTACERKQRECNSTVRSFGRDEPSILPGVAEENQELRSVVAYTFRTHHFLALDAAGPVRVDAAAVAAAAEAVVAVAAAGTGPKDLAERQSRTLLLGDRVEKLDVRHDQCWVYRW